MTLSNRGRIERGGIIKIHDSFTSKNGYSSGVGFGARGKMTGQVRKLKMVMRAESFLSGTLNFLSTNMIEAIREVLQKPITGPGATRRGSHLTNAKGGKVKGDKIWRGR